MLIAVSADVIGNSALYLGRLSPIFADDRGLQRRVERQQLLRIFGKAFRLVEASHCLRCTSAGRGELLGIIGYFLLHQGQATDLNETLASPVGLLALLDIVDLLADIEDARLQALVLAARCIEFRLELIGQI